MLQFQMLLFFSKYAAVSSSNRIPSDMNSCWNIYSCFILRKFPWILSVWIERTKMESFPTNSRVETFFSKKHTEQPCSAHCFSLALQQLLSAYTHFYLHWQYPLQTNLILFSSSHSSLGFFSYIRADETERTFQTWVWPLFYVQKSWLEKESSHPTHSSLC